MALLRSYYLALTGFALLAPTGALNAVQAHKPRTHKSVDTVLSELKTKQLPDLDQALQYGKEALSVVNTTSETVQTLIDAANTTGCQLSGLALQAADALGPLLTALKKTAEAVAALPFTGDSADVARDHIVAFVESMETQIADARVQITGGCSTLSSQMASLETKLLDVHSDFYAKLSLALEKVSGLRTELQSLIQVDQSSAQKEGFWPFDWIFGKKKEKSAFELAREAIDNANASLAIVSTQVKAINGTVIEAVVDDTLSLARDATETFESACLQMVVTSIPSKYTTKAAEFCTQWTDVLEKIADQLSEWADHIPAAVDAANEKLNSVHDAIDKMRTVVDEVEDMLKNNTSS